LRLWWWLRDREILEPSTEKIARQIVVPIFVAADESEVFESLQGIVSVCCIALHDCVDRFV
jgi:hypothetical protein